MSLLTYKWKAIIGTVKLILELIGQPPSSLIKAILDQSTGDCTLMQFLREEN